MGKDDDLQNAGTVPEDFETDVESGESGEVNDSSDYRFIDETIKDEGAGKTKKQVGKAIILAIIFGAVASFVFCVTKPWYEKMMAKEENPGSVVIDETNPPEDEGKNEGEDETAQDNNENSETEISPDDNAVIEQPIVLNLENYRQINQALKTIAQEANLSVVEITGITGGREEKMAAYDEINSTSGFIVADNGVEILVFGKTDILKEAQSITVTFSDFRTYPATLKRGDGGLGYGIYAILKADLAESTLNQIQVAKLGSSNAATKGEPVIALGKPFGYAGGIGYGILSSSRFVLDSADGGLRILSTDIAASTDGTGILVDTSGYIIGVIDQKISTHSSMNLVTAYGITDLKDRIELLSNAREVPYVGIFGMDAATLNLDAEGISSGVYVKNVTPDSPAMSAGIQNGDFITEIGGEEISNYAGYHAALMEKKVGEEVHFAGKRSGTGGEYVDIDFAVVIGSVE
ncbi:MAG: S1C family serine protease [Lachnospiraceae bacterium]|jgi:serine protease Do|nr:S1C family serine protease [Lachnospiraceae bacterium]